MGSTRFVSRVLINFPLIETNLTECAVATAITSDDEDSVYNKR